MDTREPARWPLSPGLAPNHFFASTTHDEALARLQFLIEHRHRLGLLVGPTGSGKSLLLTKLASDLRRRGAVVATVDTLGRSEREILLSLAEGLYLNPAADADVVLLWRKIRDRLTENRYQQISTVLLFDDVDSARESLSPLLLRLARIDDSPEAKLTLVVSTQLDRSGRLGARLLDLCDLRVELEPWESEDTAAYLGHVLGQRMLSREGDETPEVPNFTPDALARLQELSGGIPRRVNQLAEWSLLAATGLGLAEIDGETICAADEELGALVRKSA